MKNIELTQGQYAIVDDSDFKELNKHKWCVNWNKKTNEKYAIRVISKKIHPSGKQTRVSMHGTIVGVIGGGIVDHINHNTLDNRKCNLRIVTKSQNAMNQKKRSLNTSGSIGVHFIDKLNKWCSTIAVDGHKIHLGLYSNIKNAIESRREAEIKYFGEYRYKGESV